MIIKRKANQTDKTIILNPETRQVLFQFENGEFKTDDNSIITIWNKYYNNDVPSEPEINRGQEEEIEKPKRRGRPKKKAE